MSACSFKYIIHIKYSRCIDCTKYLLSLKSFSECDDYYHCFQIINDNIIIGHHYP